MANDMNEETLWSPEDVASYCSVKPMTVYSWIHRRIVPPPMKVEGFVRWKPSVIRQWVNDGAPNQKNPQSA